MSRNVSIQTIIAIQKLFPNIPPYTEEQYPVVENELAKIPDTALKELPAKLYANWSSLSNLPTVPFMKKMVAELNIRPDYSDVVCSCGMHKGVGEWTPENRAASYQWKKIHEIFLSGYESGYLESWIANHGEIEDNS